MQAKLGFRRRIDVLLVFVAVGVVMLNFQNVVRGLTVNHATLDASAADPALRPLVLTSTPADVADKISAWVDGRSKWAIASRQSQGGDVTLHLTRTTLLLRFTDDVHVRLIATQTGGTRLEADSRSRLGKGDLGQNPRNLKELLAAIE